MVSVKATSRILFLAYARRRHGIEPMRPPEWGGSARPVLALIEGGAGRGGR